MGATQTEPGSGAAQSTQTVAEIITVSRNCLLNSGVLRNFYSAKPVSSKLIYCLYSVTATDTTVIVAASTEIG
jgi:hypothetical protein